MDALKKLFGFAACLPQHKLKEVITGKKQIISFKKTVETKIQKDIFLLKIPERTKQDGRIYGNYKS